MIPWNARCFKCGSADLVEKPGLVEAYDEDLETTHECRVCHQKVRYTPPDDWVIALHSPPLPDESAWTETKAAC